MAWAHHTGYRISGVELVRGRGVKAFCPLSRASITLAERATFGQLRGVHVEQYRFALAGNVEEPISARSGLS